MIFLSRTIDGFSSTEYLIVFNAIIYGFITSYYFSGWGHMIQNRKRIIISYEHLFWSIFGFINLVAGWYIRWQSVYLVDDSIWSFFFSLSPMLTYYMLAVLLFPNHEKQTNFNKYLQKNKKLLFYTYALHMIITGLGDVSIEGTYLLDKQNILRIVGILVSVSGIFISNKYYHYFMLFLAYIMITVFLFDLPSIG